MFLKNSLQKDFLTQAIFFLETSLQVPVNNRYFLRRVFDGSKTY